MSSVYVGIGHDDNLMVSEFLNIKVISDTAAESSYHILYFFRIKNFIKSCFFYIEDFTSERKYCLTLSVSSVFSGTAGGITLDKENF